MLLLLLPPLVGPIKRWNVDGRILFVDGEKNNKSKINFLCRNSKKKFPVFFIGSHTKEQGGEGPRRTVPVSCSRLRAPGGIEGLRGQALHPGSPGLPELEGDVPKSGRSGDRR